jgi:hypothetical protein
MTRMLGRAAAAARVRGQVRVRVKVRWKRRRRRRVITLRVENVMGRQSGIRTSL